MSENNIGYAETIDNQLIFTNYDFARNVSKLKNEMNKNGIKSVLIPHWLSF